MDKPCCIQIVKLPPADTAKLADQLPIVDISESCKNSKINIQTILDFIEKRFGLIPGGASPEIPPVIIPTPQPIPAETPSPTPTPVPIPVPAPINPPPFIGGQCDCAIYYVTTQITHKVDGSFSPRTDEVYGPIGGAVAYVNGSHLEFKLICKGEVTYQGCGISDHKGIGTIANAVPNNVHNDYSIAIIGISIHPNWQDNCGNPPPLETPTPSPTPEYVPPFLGGQCNNCYNIYIEWDYYQDDTFIQRYPTSHKVIGPIGAWRVVPPAPGVGFKLQIFCCGGCFNSFEPTDQQWHTFSNGGDSPLTIRNVSFTNNGIVGGAPDDCGDPPYMAGAEG